MPDGVTIELLGVSEHPSKDKPWWSPSGAPIPDRFTSDVSSKDPEKSDDLTLTREFVVRLTGVPDDASDPRWATPGVNLTYTADEARRVDEQDPELLSWQQQFALAKHRADAAAAATKGMETEAAQERDQLAELRRKIDARRKLLASKSAEREPAGSRLRAMAAALPADTRKVNLRVGIATGPWKTVAQNPGVEPATRPVSDAVTEEERRALNDRMRELESEYEKKAVQTAGKSSKYQLDRLQQEESKLQAELAELNSRNRKVIEDLQAGRTPAEVEKLINNDSRYLNARQRLDDIDVELDGLVERRGQNDDLVISWKRRRQLYQQKLDEIREELKQKYAEQVKSDYKNEIEATAANIGRLHAAIKLEREVLDEFDAITREHKPIADRLADKQSRSAEFTYLTADQGQVTVYVRHDLTDLNVRIVAIDKEAGEVLPRSVGTKSVQARNRGDGKEVTAATFEIPPNQIRELRLQARPYRWAEFRDVALEPSGGKTSAGGAAQGDKAAGHARREDVETSQEIIRAHSLELIRLAKSLQDERENLGRAEKALRQADAEKRLFTPEDWARVDETMKTHVNMRNELQLRVDSLEAQLGASHPAVLRAKEDLAARQRYMDGYAQLLNAKYIILWREDGTGGALIPRDLSGLRDSIARLSKAYEARSKEVEEMRAAAAAAAAAADFGGGDPVLIARRLALVKLEGELREAREDLARAKSEIAAADKSSKPEDFARVDEGAKEILRQRDEQRRHLNALIEQGGDAANLRAMQSGVETIEARWRWYTSDLAKRFYVHWDSSGKGPSLVPRDQSALEARVERLSQEVDEARKCLESEKAR